MKKLLSIIAVPVCVAAMSVSVTTSVPSPAPLGTRVKFTATVNGAAAGTLFYRFRAEIGSIRGRIGANRDEFRTIVDYGPGSELDWTTIEHEGKFNIEVSVRNTATGETAEATVPFTFTRLKDGVSPTAHPLVFIYTAPACPIGGRVRVAFEGNGTQQFTPYQECNGRYSMNFYLAGMRANTTYTARHTADGPAAQFTTGAIPFTAPAAAPISTPVPASGGILLHGIVNDRTIATDLNGNVIWYGPQGLTFLTRAQAGGSILSIFENGSQDESHQFFREFDLAGVTIAETNAARVNEQLAALGRHPITSFHHEAIRLSNGDYLVLAGSERILRDVQGAGDVDVLGDTILVLDGDLRVKWFWDAFDYLDTRRAAVLGETCAYPATVACSAFHLAKSANDWLHGNSLQVTPDGDILYSVRHMDWVIKVDYRNGAGTGRILWRLGAGGDFRITGGGEHPWFSHQHDPNFLADNTTLAVFDNGNTRIARNPGETTSRGQMLRIDEKAMTATVLMNADLKQNSPALGTAEVLDNGHYHFDAGFIPDAANPATRYTQALETDSAGNLVWGMQIAAQEYRSFRMKDLYTPPR
jgi:arylsulfate sulfotransferase